MRLHKALGPGLLESVYRTLMARELERRGLDVVVHRPVDFEYDGVLFRRKLQVDLLVEEVVVVEVKSAETLAPVHYKQLLTYLRLLDLPLGLLLNFGRATMKEGLRRVVNRYRPAGDSPLRIHHPRRP